MKRLHRPHRSAATSGAQSSHARHFRDCARRAARCSRRLSPHVCCRHTGLHPQPNPDHVLRLAQELNIKVFQVAATAQLLAEGATVPFIARYRKEATGELDEVQVTRHPRPARADCAPIDERRAAILASLKERNLLTPALEKAIDAADTLTALEDIYLPFRPKKRTRATIAKEKGLEPLADLLFAQDPATDVVAAAQAYVGREYVADDGKNQTSKIASDRGGARRRARHHRRARERRQGRARQAARRLPEATPSFPRR